ncbi:phage tail protein [Enterococcus sp. JM4C]|uniref:sce7725 family protein n=1 Tax=Candidatus Enterococcus huntleyi TaxID=1857217 RepID=UPI001379F577|nr:sce7725 family protein [Enterococcus sp. JM4C]KAF1296916.1 phage tail protein [Enterococcus sp. JM4C]
MYYPYIRGKQFDLLALNEALNRNVLSEKIQPIIEPVKDSATIKKTIRLFQEKNHPLYVIQNPQVGQYKRFEKPVHTWDFIQDNAVKPARIVTAENAYESLGLAMPCYVFDSDQPLRQPSMLQKFAELDGVKLIPDQSRFRIWFPENKIILHDAFHLPSSSDYWVKSDDFYSDHHLYYKEDGYAGFADFTIDDQIYSDKGFPSKAITIHLTYFDAYGNIRVKHFFSESNDGWGNQADKFFEALDKLVLWTRRNADQLLITEGLQELLYYQTMRKFPGLGSIKKWSLLHHLELVSAYLEEGRKWKKRSKNQFSLAE